MIVKGAAAVHRVITKIAPYDDQGKW